MKKEYISPITLTVKLATTGMLAVSGFKESVDNDNTITTGEMLGRDGADFDEFEDEEY